MPQPFRSFVIFAAMRTGSNLLEETLKAIPGVTTHGEPFNPAFIAWPNRDSHLGVTRDERDQKPAELLGRIHNQAGLNGFRYFPGHDARVFGGLIADRTCAKVVLTRNPAESYVSLLIARDTGQWKLSDSRRRKDGLAAFDPAGFAAHLDELQAFHLQVQRALQVSGQTAFWLDYDDLTDPAILTGLARFLGLKVEKVAPSRSIVPQNPGALADKVSNPEEMRAALAGYDRFNLSRTPNFEPRRGPSVPSFVASRGAPLLFMPIRSGPTERVLAWLSAFGDGGTVTGFTQAALRDWMRDHVPHRRFTVIGHPVAHAFRAFRAVFLDSRHPNLRTQLANGQKIRLSPDDRGDPAAERAAFRAFLGFLRANLKGQTAQRVEPIWASQAAGLQGFAEFAVPDAVIRESDLAAGLAQLCDALRLAPPPLPGGDDLDGLSALYDDELERLTRAAYGRDYLAFGFSDYA